jgi:alkanesulfonate monooxygenase SsuD/methylene tetrahydromethanopterin reductase-like flavin-dependent oxidoreductase (luciferase family)
MKLGIAIFPADFAIRPDELARAVEDRGFESLFFTDHTHVPAFRSRMGASAGAGSEEALAGRPGRAWGSAEETLASMCVSGSDQSASG